MHASGSKKGGRLTPLSMSPLTPEDALRGAMEVLPPADPKPNPKKKAAKKKRKKGKKRKR